MSNPPLDELRRRYELEMAIPESSRLGGIGLPLGTAKALIARIEADGAELARLRAEHCARGEELVAMHRELCEAKAKEKR